MTDQAPALLQPELLRSLFPVLQQQVKGQPLAPTSTGGYTP